MPATTAVVAGNYGEAGAIGRYGPALGLPPAHSGQNSFWWWGAPPADATSVIAIGMGEDPTWLRGYFAKVERVATIGNAAGVENEEYGQSIWLCRGREQPWSQIWDDFQHYD